MNSNRRRLSSRSSQSYFSAWDARYRQESDNTFSSGRDSPVSPMTIPSKRADSMGRVVTSFPDIAPPSTMLPSQSSYPKRLSDGRGFRMESISEAGGGIGSSHTSRQSSIGRQSGRWSNHDHSSDATYASSEQRRFSRRPALRSSQSDRFESLDSTKTPLAPTVPRRDSGVSQYSFKDPQTGHPTPKGARSSHINRSNSIVQTPKPVTPLRGPAFRVTPPKAVSGARVVLLSDFIEPNSAQQEKQRENVVTSSPSVKKLWKRVPGTIRKLFHRRNASQRSKQIIDSATTRQPYQIPKLLREMRRRSGKSSKQASTVNTLFPNTVDNATSNLLQQVSEALEHLVADQHMAQHALRSTVKGNVNAFLCMPRRVVSGLTGDTAPPSQPVDPATAAVLHSYSHEHTLEQRWPSGPFRRFSAVSKSTKPLIRRRGVMPQATPATQATYKNRIKIASLPTAWQTQEFMRIDITDPAGPSYLPSEMRRILTPRGSQEMLGDSDEYDEGAGRGGGFFRQHKRQGDPSREGSVSESDDENNLNKNRANDRGDEQNTAEREMAVFGARWGERAQTKADDNAEAARQTAQAGKRAEGANEFARERRGRREWERVPDHLPGSPLCPASKNWWYRDRVRAQELGRERRWCPEHGWRVL